MPKNIVILCDGTSNEIEADRTNILRLYGTLVKNEKQLVYYDPGVGTFGSDGFVSYTLRQTSKVWGLVTGWGLDHNVKEAYRFLVENYDDGSSKKTSAPDRIYLFGFSRGAYTVRVLAGFINAIGLIRKENLNLLDYAYAAYKDIGEDRDDDTKGGAFSEVRLYKRILQPRRPAIECLGLFDTVSSVIEPGRGIKIIRFRSHAFTKKNPSVKSVRHAVAIDEERRMFKPQLWPAGQEYWGGPSKPKNTKDIKQQDTKEVWFTGSHGDIGGGYPEKSSALAKISLHWMIEETGKMKLLYDSKVVDLLVLGKKKGSDYVAPNSLASPNNSMKWYWKVLEYAPRRVPKAHKTERKSFMGFYIPRSEERNVPPDAVLHPSVLERKGSATDFKQTNIAHLTGKKDRRTNLRA